MKQATRAIALGYATDVLLTKLFILALALVMLDPGSASEAPIRNVSLSLLEWFGLVWGLFFTGLGGFVSARLCPRYSLLCACGVGWLSLLTSFAEGFSPATVTPVLYAVGVAMTLPVALTGSILGRSFR